MADIWVVDAGIFESISFDDNGFPVGKRFDTKNPLPEIKVVYLYLRVEGKPGFYWLTISVDGDSKEIDYSTLGRSEYLHMKEATAAGLTMPFEIDRVPPGHYVVTFSLASSKLADFNLDVSPANGAKE